jgi:hypothetical protein
MAERPTHKKCKQCKEWFNLRKRARLTQKFCCLSCACTYRNADPKWRAAQSKKVKAKTDPEVMRARSLKAWADPETRAYLTEKTRQRANTAEHRAHMKEHNAKLWADPEFRAKQTELKSKRTAAMWADPAFREKMSALTIEGNKQRWADPDYKEKTSFRIRMALNQPLQKKRLSKQGKATMSKPENRKLVSQRVAAKWQDPEYRAHMSEAGHEAALERWRDPAYRKKQAPNLAKLAKVARSPEHRARMADLNKRLHTEPEYIASRKAWWEAEGKAKHIEGNKKRWADPEFKARVSKAISEAKRRPKP